MPASDDTLLCRAALGYAARGWPVLPCQPRGKVPVTGHGFHDATADPETVREWWRAWPHANIGIVPGRCSLADGQTVLVIDVDRAAGREAANALRVPSDTASVSTGRVEGGEHRYFTVPAGVTIGNSQLAPGLDVRHVAGYVLCPPSVHPSGAVYRWRGAPAWQSGAVLPLPAELLARLTTHDVARRPIAARTVPARHFPQAHGSPGARTWRRVARYLAKVPSGLSDGRKTVGYRLGAALLHDFGLGASDAWAVLREWNGDNRPPLPDSELARVHRNAAHYGGRRARCSA